MCDGIALNMLHDGKYSLSGMAMSDFICTFAIR